MTLRILRHSLLALFLLVTNCVAHAQIWSLRQVAARGESPNAYVSHNREGKVVLVVNTPMLTQFGNNEEYMATVIGHELGHIKGNHLQ